MHQQHPTTGGPSPHTAHHDPTRLGCVYRYEGGGGVHACTNSPHGVSLLPHGPSRIRKLGCVCDCIGGGYGNHLHRHPMWCQYPQTIHPRHRGLACIRLCVCGGGGWGGGVIAPTRTICPRSGPIWTWCAEEQGASGVSATMGRGGDCTHPALPRTGRPYRRTVRPRPRTNSGVPTIACAGRNRIYRPNPPMGFPYSQAVCPRPRGIGCVCCCVCWRGGVRECTHLQNPPKGPPYPSMVRLGPGGAGWIRGCVGGRRDCKPLQNPPKRFPHPHMVNAGQQGLGCM